MLSVEYDAQDAAAGAQGHLEVEAQQSSSVFELAGTDQ